MKQIYLFSLGMAVMLTLGCSSQKDFMYVDGVSIMTPDGSDFRIRGTNVGNWLNPEGYMFNFNDKANSYKMINDALCQLVGPEFTSWFWQEMKMNYVTEDDIRYLAETGVNTIRMPFHYKLFTDEDYMGLVSDQDGLEIIDKFVEWCKKYGIYVILDMHDCPGGQTGTNIDDSYGYPWLFESERFQEQFIDIWVRIASHFANETAILGYDLMNEPIASRFPDDVQQKMNYELEPLLIRTTEAIRKVDKNHIVLLPGAQWNTNFSVFEDFDFDDNIMYTCHQYKTAPTHETLDRKVRFMQRSNRPMYMGETGENTPEWCREFRESMEDCDIGWTYWTYKRLASDRCFMSIKKPENWDMIVNFIKSDRTTYDSIRENRPSQDMARRVLEEYVENCKFQNCAEVPEYVTALGFIPQNELE